MRSSDRTWWVAVLLLAMAGAGAMQLLPVASGQSPAGMPAPSRIAQEANAARLRAMTAEQRTLFEQRVAEWDALPRTQREDRRARYQAWRELDEGERTALRAVAAQVAAYPPERQQALQAQFAALDESARHGWRLGPVLGADYGKLHSLIAFVPADQRLPLLGVLRAMDAQQRAELAVLAQRTPPQERQALRAELLALPSTQRGAWLRRRLDQ